MQKVIFHAVGEQVRKYRTNWRLQIVISFLASVSLSYFGTGLLGFQKLVDIH